MVHQIEETANPEHGLILHRVFDGDETTIGYLAGLVGNPRREAMNKESLYMFLGPRLRSNPRIQEIMVQLGYPRPRS